MAEREVVRTRRRRTEEPWRALYDTDEWKECKRIVRRRDEHRCRVCNEPYKRSKPGGGLSVHHRAPLATLWLRASEDWETFLIMGTNPNICVLLCGSCHTEADNELRDQQGYRDKARYAKPRVPASQRRRRR